MDRRAAPLARTSTCWVSTCLAEADLQHPIGKPSRDWYSTFLRFSACRPKTFHVPWPQQSKARLQFRQAKNEHRNPIDIDIPVHPELCIDSRHTCVSGDRMEGHLPPTVRQQVNGLGVGRPTSPLLGPRRSKGDAQPAWQRQRDAHEIMSVTGHRTLAEVERYTRAARMAQIAAPP